MDVIDSKSLEQNVKEIRKGRKELKE